MGQDNSRFYPSRNARPALREDQRAFLDGARVSLGLPSLFYASLRHPRIFAAVTGRPLEACEWERAAIRGFRIGIANAGTGYPGIFPATEGDPGELECIITHDLSRFEQTMVAWYEWDEYVLQRVTLADGRCAQVFVPDLDAIRREYGSFGIEPWSLEAWQRGDVDQAVADAREWMAQRPDDDALEQAGCCTPAQAPADGRAAG